MTFASTLPIMMPKKSSPKSLVGAKIRDLRSARGLTGEDVATAIGRVQSRVSKWEIGQGQPYPADLVRLADLFEVDVRYLCDDSQTEPNKGCTEKTEMARGESWELTEDEKFLIMLSREVGGARHIASRFLASITACEEERQPSGTAKPLTVRELPFNPKGHS